MAEAVDVVQPLNKVGRIICYGLFLFRGAPNIISQGRRNFLPNTMFAGVTPVVSWVDVQ